MPQCAICGEDFAKPRRGSGKYCRRHQRSDSRQRSAKRAADRGDEAAPPETPDKGSLILRATRALLTARGDDDLAREILSQDLPEDLVSWALAKARATRKEVLDGDPGSGLALLHELHTQAALRGLESVGEMSGHSAAGSTKQIGDAIETANLAGKRVYSRVLFVLPDRADAAA